MPPVPPISQASHSWVPPAPTLLSLALLLLSFLHYLSGPTGLAWLAAFKWAALGAVAVGCPPIALKAWGAIRSGVSAEAQRPIVF